jgi:hypothetical protein
MKRRRWWLAAAIALGVVLVAALAFTMIRRGNAPHAPTAIAQASAAEAPLATSDPTSHTLVGELPNADLTPGAIASSDVSTICRPGYATHVRPKGSEWNRLKDEAYDRYGLARGHRSSIDDRGVRHAAYEVDHLIPLELGGAPADMRNLWPEAIDSARQKDKVENDLHSLVCSGRMSLGRAQESIARNWKIAIP